MKLCQQPKFAAGLAFYLLALTSFAGPFQTVSVSDPSLVPTAAAGDSYSPLMTPDGRFVLFSSTAQNLATNANGSALTAYFPAKLNVYLRDRQLGTTTLISGNQSQLNGGNGDSVPDDISTNGQFAVFESGASDLVPNDTNSATDIFLRDAVNGTTTLISVATNDSPANGDSRSAVMTPDGRFVAFVSAASNLVAFDTNGIADIFLRDTLSNTTTLITAGATGLGATCESPEITPDGRYIAFYSSASALAAGVTNTGDLYLCDTVASNMTWVSGGAHTAMTNANIAAFDHCLSTNGQYVAFQAKLTNGSSTAWVFRYNAQTAQTDLIDTNAFVPFGAVQDVRTMDMTPDGRFVAYVENVSTPGVATMTTCINIWDAQSGTVTLASPTTTGTVAVGYVCDAPSIDPSGRFVAFVSNAPNLVTNSVTAGFHCYIYDLVANVTTLVDSNTNGVSSGVPPSTIPRLSRDARYAAFQGYDSQMVVGDNNRAQDVFVRDLVTDNVELISARASTLPNPTTPAGSSMISSSSVSTDGRFIAFSSMADNLVTNDFNTNRDIFVRDLLTGTTTLVSVSTNGSSANSASSEPSISGDGRYVAFSSYATDLVPKTTNRWQNVFVADRQTGSITLVSKSATGAEANGNSYSPIISRDGQSVLFHSKGNNLTTNFIGSAVENLFLRTLQNSNVYALTTGSVTDAVFAADSRHVLYSGIYTPQSATGLLLWDSQTLTRTLVHSGGGERNLSISADGSKYIYYYPSSLTLYDNNGTAIATPVSVTPRFPAHISADGNSVVYCALGNIFVYDEINHFRITLTQANDPCDFPDISADGRFVVFRSAASNLVQNMTFPDTNGAPRLFLADRFSGTTILSAGATPHSGGSLRSQQPVFSGDGRTIVFSSFASDLVDNDVNQSSDIFEFAFLYANLTVDPIAGGKVISWLVTPGQTYHVQYKDDLNDVDWQTLSGTITITGNRASIQDTTANGDKRIYRLAAF